MEFWDWQPNLVMGFDLRRSTWTGGIRHNANAESYAPSTGRDGRWSQIGDGDAYGAHAVWFSCCIGLRILCLRIERINPSAYHAPDPLAALKTGPRP